MVTDAFPQPSPEDVALLAKINTALAALGSTGKWKRLPEFQPEYQILLGKKIVIIDDYFMILQNMIPELMVASGGNAEAIHHTGESLQELVDMFLSRQPDIIIMDYNLAAGLKGTSIVRELFKRGFTGKIVGGSSEPERVRDFIAVGALGNIDESDEVGAVKDLAKLVK